MKYKQDIFYNPESIMNYDKFKKDAIKKSKDINLQQKYKDDNITWGRREPTKKSLKWILEKSEIDELKIIHRYKTYDWEKERFEIIFIHDWYFAWCNIDLKEEDYFVKKYHLKTY